MLAALACVDFVVIFDADTAEALVRALRPEVYVKGGDYAPGSPGGDGADRDVGPAKPLPEAALVHSYGGAVVLAPYRAGYSTSALIAEIVARFAPGTSGRP